MLISTLLRSWQQQWQQIGFVLLGMLCGIAGLSAVLIINETAKQKIDGLNGTLVGNIYGVATLKPKSVFTNAQYAELRRDGLEIIAAARFQRLINHHTLQFLAVDSAALLTAASLSRINADKMNADSPDHIAADSTQFMQPQEVQQHNLFRPLTSRTYYENVIAHINSEDLAPFTMPMVAAEIQEDLVYLSLAHASTLDEPLHLNELWIISEPLASDIDRLKAIGFDVQFVEYQNSNITASFHINIFAMGGLMLVVSFFVVLNAYNLLLSGRVTFIKQLYVLGISVKQLRRVFILEAWFWGVFCVAFGFYLGELLAQLLAPGVKQTLEGLYDVNFSEQQPGIMALKLQIALVTFAALSLTIIVPLNGMLKRLVSGTNLLATHSGSRFGFMLLSAALLLVLLAIELLFPQSLLMSFVVIVLIVLSGCFATLYLLPKLLILLQNNISVRHPITHYFACDAVRLSQRNSIAFCAFFIAITANIGMNLMVDSFREATQSWLNKQFVADLYLATDSPEKIRQWQNEQSDVFIYERVKANIRLQGQKTELIALPETGYENLNLIFKSPDPWSIQPRSNSIFINEQLSIRGHLAVGDTIILKDRALVIEGIYYDYGNMQNQMIVAPELVRSLQKKAPARHLFSVTKHPHERGNQPLINQESGHLVLHDFIHFLQTNDIDHFTGENIRTLSVDIFDQTFVITSVLNIVTLLVAGISLATSIIIVARQNKHHYGILRRIGVNASQIRTANFIQYSYIVTLLFCCAIPFGLILSWMLIHKINYLSFYWTYPMVINIGPILFVYGLALATITLCLLFSFTVNRSNTEVTLPGALQ